MIRLFVCLGVLAGCVCPHQYETQPRKSQIKWPETPAEIEKINYQLRRELDLETPCQTCSGEGVEIWHSKLEPHLSR